MQSVVIARLPGHYCSRTRLSLSPGGRREAHASKLKISTFRIAMASTSGHSGRTGLPDDALQGIAAGKSILSVGKNITCRQPCAVALMLQICHGLHRHDEVHFPSFSTGQSEVQTTSMHICSAYCARQSQAGLSVWLHLNHWIQYRMHT